MKKIITICAALIMTASVFAQAPEKMSYQAVVRDGSNALVTSTAVGMQTSILQGSSTGTVVYVETQTPSTNANGLVSLEIGVGTVVSGDFTTIDWANGPYFIKTETDPTGGTSYTITGTSELLSVPYALYAKTAENGITTAQANEIAANTLKVGITAQQASDITTNNAKVGITTAQANEIAANTLKVGITAQQASDITTNNAKVGVTPGTAAGQMQYWNGTAWVVVAATPNEGAALQMIGGVPTWTGGTPPPPSVAVGDFIYGGVVFWVNPLDDTKGLVCAVEDQSAGIQWFNGFPSSTTGASGISIGTGQSNTNTIIASLGPVETDYAAGLAKSYIGGGNNDWFLPSKDELAEMYLNRAAINATSIANAGTVFALAYYWSSTEGSIDLAWRQDFSNGAKVNGGKSGIRYVRAVRAF